MEHGIRRLRAARVAAAVTFLAVTTVGCAAHWAYRQGRDAAEKGDWDLAVARLTRALEKDRGNIGYKIALENARIQASRHHYDQARKHLAASDFPKAAEELEIASKFDPANRSAADDLVIVRRRIEKQAEEQREREQLEATKSRAQAARPPLPALSASSNVPISMRFESDSVKKIFEALGKVAGVNVLFDDALQDTKKTSIVFRDLTFQESLDRISLVNKLFYKVLDQNTIIVAAESLPNRRKYDELLLRTFYLQNAELNETANLIKQVAKITTVGTNTGLGAITVLGTLDQLAMTERIVEANDKARGEVIVEVQVLEVNRSAAKNWGLNLSAYSASATLSPTGSANELDATTGLLSLRAHLLSSLNQADWVVSIPSTIFTQFLQREDTGRILAAPRLRAAEGKKTELKIGTDIPIPVTSIGVGLGGANQGGLGGYYPATSFTYKTVGVTVNLEPLRVAASGDITLQVMAEFSILGPDRNVGTAASPLQVPTFLTRNVTALLRLRDGETGLIGGLLQGSESRTFAGSIGMNSLPIIGNLLGNRSRKKEDSEILISITPRIVRGPKLTEEDFVPLAVGTAEVPRVESARQPFGPPPEAAPRSGLSGPAAAGLKPPGSANAPAPAAPERTTGPTPAGEQPAPAGGTGSPSAGAAPSPSAGAPPAPPAGSPAPTATVVLSPSQVSLRVGQSGGVAVVLVGASDVQWVEIVLVHDPNLGEVTDVAPGALLTLDGAAVAAERALGAGRVRARFERPSPVSGSGQVAAVSLRGTRAGAGVIALESVRFGRPDGTIGTPLLPAAGRLTVVP